MPTLPQCANLTIARSPMRSVSSPGDGIPKIHRPFGDQIVVPSLILGNRSLLELASSLLMFYQDKARMKGI